MEVFCVIDPKNGGKLSLLTAVRYPQKVACKDLVEKVVVSTTTKIVAPTTVTAPILTSTNTITATTTATGTSTLTDATVTLTQTNSATGTTTTTTTTTATSVSNVPGPTFTTYAACSANNMINSANGGSQFAQIQFNSNIAISTASSGIDCCMQCQQATTNCAFFFYTDDGTCFTDTTYTCQAGVSDGTFSTNSQHTPANSILGNGACGSVSNGGGG